MNFEVINIEGKKVQTLELNDSIWAIEPHNQAMFDAVISYRASMRQGTKKVKTRAEVSGGGRKPWRQKGTGRARQGSIRAPQWRGGGITFGPNPNVNYSKHVNKKVRRLAFKSALSLKVKENNLIILDQLSFKKPSTKEMIKVMNSINITDEKSLFVTSNEDFNIFKSTSNLKNAKSLCSKKINVYELLNYKKLIITMDAINDIEEVYK